ncbi:MAG TPA: hypothetical protein VFQ65_01805 [Kofleriaceae bacterium]|nr:hypothetical protein [Kofleriaceae bacterium]
MRVELEVPRTLVVRPRIALHDAPLRLILESLIAETSDGASSRLFRDAIARRGLLRDC